MNIRIAVTLPTLLAALTVFSCTGYSDSSTPAPSATPSSAPSAPATVAASPTASPSPSASPTISTSPLPLAPPSPSTLPPLPTLNPPQTPPPAPVPTPVANPPTINPPPPELTLTPKPVPSVTPSPSPKTPAPIQAPPPEVSPAPVPTQAVPDSAAEEIFKIDRHFLAGIQGGHGSALHHELFGGPVDGGLYFKYLNARVTSALLGECSSELAFACFKSEYPHSLTYTAKSLSGDYPQILRVMTMVHEARHSEADHGYYLHEECPSDLTEISGAASELAGTRNCDSDLHGAYGISLVMVENISKFCTNCTDKVKQDAEMWVDGTLRSIDVEEERMAFFKDINSKLGIPWNPQTCTYTDLPFDGQGCDAAFPYMLLINGQPSADCPCFSSLDDVSTEVSLDRYKGICK